jgi:hypothetical protein
MIEADLKDWQLLRVNILHPLNMQEIYTPSLPGYRLTGNGPAK